MRTRLLYFLVPTVLGTILAIVVASFVIGSRTLARRPPDPFLGRELPCGHIYRGRRSDINGLLYFWCEKGHPFPQRNEGGLFEAR
jgi:hypothetical protein